MCASSPFGFEGGMWDLIVFIPNHCLSFSSVLSIGLLGVSFQCLYIFSFLVAQMEIVRQDGNVSTLYPLPLNVLRSVISIFVLFFMKTICYIAVYKVEYRHLTII